jgi:hypothetical protein
MDTVLPNATTVKCSLLLFSVVICTVIHYSMLPTPYKWKIFPVDSPSFPAILIISSASFMSTMTVTSECKLLLLIQKYCYPDRVTAANKLMSSLSSRSNLISGQRQSSRIRIYSCNFCALPRFI